jgi:rubrerythrin
MKTSEQWWDEVKASPEKFNNWLKLQYHGEATAEKRIRSAIEKFSLTGFEARCIESVADDEKRHAVWVAKLLKDRGIEPEVLEREERYWNEVLPEVYEKNTFTYFCAVGSLAETMRLERIMILASEPEYADIADVFKKIYSDEIFHARIFKELSTKEDIAHAEQFHNMGMNAIGLIA